MGQPRTGVRLLTRRSEPPSKQIRAARGPGAFWVLVYLAIPLVGAVYFCHAQEAPPRAESSARRAPEVAESAESPSTAHLLAGVIAFRGGRLDAAKAAFAKAVDLAPSDPAAHFNLAVVAHQEGRYRDAREGYLRALHLDPDYLDARYNLGLLVQSAGAMDEARHHLSKLRARAKPGDPRVARLERVLQAHAEAAPSAVATFEIRGLHPTPPSPAPSASP